VLNLSINTVVNAKADYNYTIRWNYTNRGQEKYNFTEVDLGLPYFNNNSYQEIVFSVRGSSFKVIALDDGFSKILINSHTSLKSAKSYQVNITYHIKTSEKEMVEIEPKSAGEIHDIPNEYIKHIKSCDVFPANNMEIKDIAQEITEDEVTVLSKVFSLIDWFKEYSIYKYSELPRYPNITIRDPRGDCDDMSILFITMCRSIGIPAILQTGLIINQNLQGEDIVWERHLNYTYEGLSWHAWAMVYIPPYGWLPVDLTLSKSLTPIDAIIEAPYWRPNMVVAWNITEYDYVKDEINHKENLISNNIFLESYNICTAKEYNEIKQINRLYYFIPFIPLLLYYVIKKSVDHS
jgi:transglutaminase-like putative cysteine protease